MGHKRNKCVSCGKDIWDGSTQCKSCCQKGSRRQEKVFSSLGISTDDELFEILVDMYITRNMTQTAMCKALGITSVSYHIKRLCIVKTGKNMPCNGNASYGWVHKGHGARYVCVNGVEVLEHRHVMEQHLGRKLWRGEIVHHTNHNRLDNRIENLQLMTRSEHTTHHNLIRHARKPLPNRGR